MTMLDHPLGFVAVGVSLALYALTFLAYRCWAKRDRARFRSLREGGP